MDVKFKFNTGDKVKDKVTGFVGIVESATIWLNKCKRYTVRPVIERDGKFPEGVGLDEEQLELIKAEKVQVDKEEQTGGPHDEVKRHDNPKR